MANSLILTENSGLYSSPLPSALQNQVFGLNEEGTRLPYFQCLEYCSITAVCARHICSVPSPCRRKETEIKLQQKGESLLVQQGWLEREWEEGRWCYQSLVWLHFLSLEETFLQPAGKIYPAHLGNGTFGKEGHGRSFINMKMSTPMWIYCICTLWSWPHYLNTLKYVNLRVW